MKTEIKKFVEEYKLEIAVVGGLLAGLALGYLGHRAVLNRGLWLEITKSQVPGLFNGESSIFFEAGPGLLLSSFPALTERVAEVAIEVAAKS